MGSVAASHDQWVSGRGRFLEGWRSNLASLCTLGLISIGEVEITIKTPTGDGGHHQRPVAAKGGLSAVTLVIISQPRGQEVSRGSGMGQEVQGKAGARVRKRDRLSCAQGMWE